MPSNLACQRFLYGRCPFSAFTCTQSHNKEHAPLCRMWQKGYCIGATGNACKFRHYYNDLDGAMMQAAKAIRPPPVETNQLENFDSPYRVKVIKETAKQRMVEVDLETGKRKSWVETTEFEVLDLTGETPVKKTRQPLTNSPLAEANKKDNQVVAGNSKKAVVAGKAKQAVGVAAAADADPGTCPVCGKGFKGEKGVRSHRRAKNSACHPDKENQEARSHVARPPSTPLSGRGVSVRPAQDQDDSIIIIPDTPVPGNRRVSLRRSMRMA